MRRLYSQVINFFFAILIRHRCPLPVSNFSFALVLGFFLLGFGGGALVGQEPDYTHDAPNSRNLDRFTLTLADALNPEAKINRLIISVDTNPEGERFVLTYGNGIKRVGDNDGLIDFIPNQNDRLSNPLDLAINSEGKFFVATNESNRRFIRVYSPEGAYLGNQELGNGDYGNSGADRFKGPTGLAFDNDDNLYVADHYIGDNNPSRPSSIKIYRKDASGNYKNNLVNEFDNVQGTLLNFPYRLAVNSQGHLYMAELGQNNNASVKVLQFDNNFNPTQIDEISGNGIGSPGSIIIDKFDNIFIADLGEDLDLSRVLEATNDVNEFYEVFEIIKRGIANDLFNINVYNPDNTFRIQISSQIDFPIDLAISNCGTLYVNNAIFDGTIRSFFGRRIPDITIDFDLEAYQRSPGYDTEAPGLVFCPEDQQGELTNGTFALLDYRDMAEFEDNCDDDLIYIQTPAAETTITEDTEVEIIALDDAGNESAPCKFWVRVPEPEDIEDPVITCPAIETFSVTSKECGTIVNYASPTASDNSGDVTIEWISGSKSGEFVEVGIHRVTYRATDAAGNFDECSFEITVVDDEAPVITSCPGNLEFTVAYGETGRVVDYALPSFTDNCSVTAVTRTAGPASGEFFGVGDTTVTYEARDDEGNTVSCSFTVSIEAENLSAPVFEDCPADLLYIITDNGQCGVVVTFSVPTATDDNGNVEVQLIGDYASGDVFPVGTTTVSFEATNAAGTTTCSFDVRVTDDEDPAITSCPGNLDFTVAYGETGREVEYDLPTFTDNCSVATVTRTAGPASGEFFGVGDTTVTYEARDDEGNTFSCSFIVSIEAENLSAPTFEDCPADLPNITTDNGQCGAVVIFSTPNAIDENGNVEVELISDYVSGDIFPVGTTTVLFEATNAAGTTICSFDVIVTDDEDPEILSCPGNLDFTVAYGETGREVEYDLPTFTDNCSVATVTRTAGPASGEFFGVGDTTVTYEARDDEGNTVSCSFTVSIEAADLGAPVFEDCPADLPNMITDNGQCGAVVTFSTPNASDENGNVEVQLIGEYASGDVFPVGTTTVSFQASNAAGTAICSFDITVTDDEAPEILSCPGNLDFTVAYGETGREVEYALPTFTDNCSVTAVTRTTGPASGEFFGVGDTTVTYEARDDEGNTVSCSFSVSIEAENLSAPTFEDCPADLPNITTDNGQCGAVVTFSTPNAIDENGNVEVELISDYASGDIFPVGTTTVSFEATNAAGTTTCTFTVTIIDNEIPEFENCASSRTANYGPEVGFTVPDYRDELGVSDNCTLENDLLITQNPAPGETIYESQEILFTVEDLSENAAGCSFTLTLIENIDDVPPTFVDCPSANGIAQEAAPGLCESVVQFSVPEAIDRAGNGIAVALTSDLGPGDNFPIGDTEVVFTATGENGLSATCTFTVTILDNEIPEIATCVGPKTANFDPEVGFEVPDYRDELVVSDNCTSDDELIITQNPVPGEIIFANQQILFRVEDAAGRTAECSFQLTLEEEATDDPLEISGCPGPQQGNLDRYCTFTIPDFTGGVSTNIPANVTQVPTPGSSIYQDTRVSVIATTSLGEVEICYVEITLDTSLPDALNCPPEEEEADYDPNQGYFIGSYLSRYHLDFCDRNFTVVQTPEFGTPITEDTEVKISVSDAAGNEISCEFLVKVPGDTPDILVARDDQYVVEDFDQLFSVPVETGILRNDDFSPEVLPQIEIITRPAGALNMDPDGSFTYLPEDGFTGQDFFSYRLNDGTTTSEVAMVFLNVSPPENTAPIASSEEYIIDPNQVFTVNAPGVLANDIDPDGDDLTARIVSLPAYGELTLNPDGSFTYVANDGFPGLDSFKYVAADGEFESDETEVTLRSINDSPIVNDDFYTTAQGEILDVEFDDGVLQNDEVTSDNYEVVMVEWPGNGSLLLRLDGSFVYTPHPDFTGEELFTYYVSNGEVNSIIASVTINVTAVAQPLDITCPGDREAELGEDCEFTVPDFRNEAVTNDPGADISQSPSPGTIITESTTITLSAVLGEESDSCTFELNLRDRILPVASCVDLFTVQLDANGIASISPEDIDNGSTDNCGIVSKDLSQYNFTTADIGQQQVTLTVADAAGNTNSCETFVEVQAFDGTPQDFCPRPTTLALDENGELEVSVYYEGDAEVHFELSKDYFTCADIGTHTLTVNYSGDFNGTCTSELTIVDNLPPQINCVSGYTVELNAQGVANISAEQLALRATDNCGIASMSLDQTNFTTEDVGEHEVTLTVTDASGNVTTCAVNVVVEPFEETEPDFECVDSVTLQLDHNGGANLSVQDLYTGDGSGISFNLDKQNFTCADIGEQNVTLTYSGEVTGSCQISVTVQDSIAPEVICISETVRLDEDGTAVISVEDIDNGSLDNCGIASRSLSKTTFTTADIGEQQVTLTVTDAAGNQSSCVATVTVLPYETFEPGFRCVESIVLELDANGTARIHPRQLFTGNYETIEYSVTRENFTCADLGEQTVTLSYTTSGGDGTCEVTVVVTDPLDSCYVGPVEPGEDAYVIIYPNPGKGVVQVNTSEDINLLRARVFDMRGRFLFEKEFIQPEDGAVDRSIDLRKYQSGVYTIIYYSETREYIRRAIISLY